MGFQFLDFFVQKKMLQFKASKFQFHITEGELFEQPFVLLKPDTYVNNSGLAVLDCINHFKIEVNDVLVVVDDINLALSKIRIRKSGGDGGHNGLYSIIYHLESKDFSRLRIGIGDDFEIGNLANYVLSDFNKDDFVKLETTFNQSIQLVDSFISDGYNKMLNTFSRLKNLNKLNNETE